MTSELALQMGKAIGTVMKGTIAIATDTRVSADMIKAAVSSGIMAVGANILDLGVLPTPAIQYYVKMNDDVNGGVMITASHNPPQFNGIKCISSDGTDSSRTEEQEIEKLYNTDIPCKPWNNIGNAEIIREAGEEYVNAILAKIDVEAIRNANLKVCLDCANGAGVYTSPLLLKKLNVRAITLNGNAQGEFPGRPSEPTEENLRGLMTLTKSTKSNLGIAHDGDADCCTFISDDGKFVSGDKSLALVAQYILSEKNGKIVTPVSSSKMVEEVVQNAGGILKYTAVGSPTVVRKMMEYEAIFGGEDNGGLIFPDHQYCRDGGMTIAKMLELIVKNGSLKSQVSKLPVYYIEKRKVECPKDRSDSIIEYLGLNANKATTDHTDGLKLIFDDGWVLARPSGTEPIFRIYSESQDKDMAIKRADLYEELTLKFLEDVPN